MVEHARRPGSRDCRDQRCRGWRWSIIALSADIRIGSENAKFTVPFLKLGIHPGMATTYLLPEVVGLPQHATSCSPAGLSVRSACWNSD